MVLILLTDIILHMVDFGAQRSSTCDLPVLRCHRCKPVSARHVASFSHLLAWRSVSLSTNYSSSPPERGSEAYSIVGIEFYRSLPTANRLTFSVWFTYSVRPFTSMLSQPARNRIDRQFKRTLFPRIDGPVPRHKRGVRKRFVHHPHLTQVQLHTSMCLLR